MLMPAKASAASPVLELVAPGRSLPVSFTTESGPVVAELAGFEMVVHCAASQGAGEITGPRSAVSHYEFTGCVARGPESEAKCKSKGANPEEITTGPIAAELVYLDQAKREAGVLMNPGGGIYMSFECGSELTEARGSFLAPVTPVNTEASAFTATLTGSAGLQTPDEYENLAGEKLKATPEGKRESSEWVTTGVAATFMVHPSVPIEIKALTSGEVEAKQREEEEAKQREQRQREEAAAKRRQEEEVAASQKRAEEATTALQSAIGNALTAGRKVGRIGTLLKHGGFTLPFSSSEPGTLVVQWWQVPRGAHLAKKHKPKSVLVARGRAAFSTAGVAEVKIDLTRDGRRLLAHAIKLKLIAEVQFTPTGHPAISATGTLTLRR
jgi:hypothetical protein